VNQYGNPYQQVPPQVPGLGSNFGGFINDPTAQMGFSMGKSALNAGTDYMEQNASTRNDLAPYGVTDCYHR